MIRLRAPEDYWKLTPAAKDELTNGCGPSGWKGLLVPDELLGVKITEPCNIHDFRYGLGGTEDDRKTADREFLANNLEVVEEQSSDWALLETRRELALRYYCAVRDHGRTYFSFHEKEIS